MSLGRCALRNGVLGEQVAGDRLPRSLAQSAGKLEALVSSTIGAMVMTIGHLAPSSV